MRWIYAATLLTLAAALPQRREKVQHLWDPDCGTSAVGDEAGGERPVTDIIGGWDVLRGEWPWQVVMGRAPGYVGYYCGASVMNQDWVITAAHCCEGELATNVYLTVGEHDFAEDDTENPSRAVHTVSDVIMHENYGPITLINDICLLKLDNPITYNEYVGAVCPPEAGNDYVGVTASTSGWGDMGAAPQSTILQTVNMPIITNEVCHYNMTQEQPTWFVSRDMICAGEPGNEERDTCQGDSGGPLVTKNAGGLWELIGLTSWGFECAAGVPGVYCRVEYFLDWIDEKLATTMAA